MFESKDDFDIFSDLCRRFNREEAFTGGKEKMEWVEEIYNGARLQGRGLGVRMPNFAKFWAGAVSSNSQQVKSGFVMNHSVTNQILSH